MTSYDISCEKFCAVAHMSTSVKFMINLDGIKLLYKKVACMILNNDIHMVQVYYLASH